MRASLATLDPALSKLRHLLALGAGGGGELTPLPRFRFVAGDTNQTGLNGSVAEPYKTIGEFDTAFAASASIADANAPVVAFVTPAINGYNEAINVPAYRQVEYRADNFGTKVIGDVTWNNVAGSGTHVPTNLAFAAFHNLNIGGNLTCTDDAGAPTSVLLLTADELALGTATLTGNIDTTGTTHLGICAISGWLIQGTIDLGTTCALTAVQDELGGNITARSVSILDCLVGATVTAITVNGAQASQILNTAFVPGGNPVLTGPVGSTLSIDGPSWRSFLEAGGTVAAGGISVLVVGGYDGGPIQGANIGDVGATLSLNGTGAGGTWAAGGNSYAQTTALTGNRVIQFLLGGGEKAGDTMLVTRTVVDANGFHITFEDDTGATLLILAGANRGSIKVRFNGTHWVLAQGFGT